MTTSQFPSRQQPAQGAREALEVLTARREALSEQFEAVTQRRGMLAQERLNAEARARAGGNQDRQIVRELEQQVAELGQRSAQLQRELMSTEDALAALQARGVAQGGGGAIAIPTPAMPTFISVPPDRGGAELVKMRYERFMLMEALAFVLLGVVGGRLLWRMATRRAQRAVAPVAGVSEMQQALDVIAVEVERIAENQRYVTKLLSEQSPAEKVMASARKEPERR